MLRIVLGVVGGFIAWLIVWVGSEKAISAVWPAFGSHQQAFEEAIKNGGQFTPNSTMLFTHIVLGSAVSVLAGYLASVIAGENKLAPLIVGGLLLLMGIAKATMSWQLVPIWYHVSFTLILLPMAFLGGKLIATN
jgi:hypothetical protein